MLPSFANLKQCQPVGVSLKSVLRTLPGDLSECPICLQPFNFPAGGFDTTSEPWAQSEQQKYDALTTDPEREQFLADARQRDYAGGRFNVELIHPGCGHQFHRECLRDLVVRAGPEPSPRAFCPYDRIPIPPTIRSQLRAAAPASTPSRPRPPPSYLQYYERTFDEMKREVGREGATTPAGSLALTTTQTILDTIRQFFGAFGTIMSNAVLEILVGDIIAEYEALGRGLTGNMRTIDDRRRKIAMKWVYRVIVSLLSEFPVLRPFAELVPGTRSDSQSTTVWYRLVRLTPTPEPPAPEPPAPEAVPAASAAMVRQRSDSELDDQDLSRRQRIEAALQSFEALALAK